MQQRIFCLLFLLIGWTACQSPNEQQQTDGVEGGKKEVLFGGDRLKEKAGQILSDEDRKKLDVTKVTGKWEVNLLDARMVSARGIPDSTLIISVRKNNMLEALQVDKMEYSFRKNGRYNILYRNVDDRILRTFSGDWSTKNNVLILEEKIPKPNTYYYEITAPFEADLDMRLRGVLDYDYDGEEDDKVVMVLDKVGE